MPNDDEKKRIKRICKLRAILDKTAKGYDWHLDDQGHAAYYLCQWYEKSCLFIFLRCKPSDGRQVRNLGAIEGGVLDSTAWKRHKKFKCRCIARYPLEHADRFGITHVRIPGGAVMTVAELLARPELPREASATFERQVMLPEYELTAR
jgi:hypothetical protein